MPSNFIAWLKQYNEITILQQKAIEQDDIESLEDFGQQKQKIIKEMKKLTTLEVKNNKSIKEEVNKVIAKDKEVMELLQQAKKELGKNISNSKKRRTALNAYSKNMK